MATPCGAFDAAGHAVAGALLEPRGRSLQMVGATAFSWQAKDRTGSAEPVDLDGEQVLAVDAVRRVLGADGSPSGR